MFVITLITEALPSGPMWKISLPIASNSGRCARNVASSPPTSTVISPAAALWTPPVTGRLERGDALLRRERGEAEQLVTVVRARVDPRRAGRQPGEDAVLAGDDRGRPRPARGGR